MPGTFLLTVGKTMSWGGRPGAGRGCVLIRRVCSPQAALTALSPWPAGALHPLGRDHPHAQDPHNTLCRCMETLLCRHSAKEGPAEAETLAQAPGVQPPRKGSHFLNSLKVPANALAQSLLPAAKGHAAWPPPKVNVFMSLQTGRPCQKGQPQFWHRGAACCNTLHRKLTHTPPSLRPALRLAWS